MDPFNLQDCVKSDDERMVQCRRHSVDRIHRGSLVSKVCKGIYKIILILQLCKSARVCHEHASIMSTSVS
eukprot:939384-Pelagomonas_calceolata.AAC.1